MTQVAHFPQSLCWFAFKEGNVVCGKRHQVAAEFLDTVLPDGTVARGFDVGTLNAHHGPFMNFCGAISLIDERPDGAERDLADIKLAVHCKDSFHLQSAAGEVLMKTDEMDVATFGSLIRGFTDPLTDEAVFVTQDLSVHHYKRSEQVSLRYEALSQVT